VVGVRVNGGMGNQLFQYAFITTAASAHKCQFFLDKEGAPIEIYRYFKLDKTVFYYADIYFFNYNGFRLFFSHYLRKAFYALIKKCFIKKTIKISNTDDPVQSAKLADDEVLFEGFFQSPYYFRTNSDRIRKLFEIQDHYRAAYLDQYQFLGQGKRKVTIHIRKTDYQELGHLNLGGADLSLPYSFYHRIIKEIHDEENYYIFISDTPELIVEEFEYLPQKFISSDTAIIDFQHMLNSDICVIANSTFSWWAAFLNKNPGKKVYCPEYFLGFRIQQEYPAAIYPAEWVQKKVHIN